MIVCIANVLERATLEQVRDLLAQGSYVDGKQTAGWHAKLVKHNQQLARSEPADHADKLVRDALLAHPVFNAAVQPKRLRRMLFSRYEGGNAYGAHVDDALMGAGPKVETDGDSARMRSDVSMTVFLSDPQDYDGGDLVIEGTGGEQSYKLEAGHAITYPSNTLHYVAEVTRGTREVAVTWAQSLVRAPEQREVLFDLDTARRTLFQREGKSREFDLMSKTHANLTRMWAEP